ncbi:MAG: polysaccharide pyruvyl transferase family protein [Rhodospirillales bacterium]|nr:polysaccharide pyruvyl transferase family protein [Rhodospirillales bacterium]
MANVLVISPSGEVYDHDCVRWYQHSDVQRSIRHYHNSGDMFVFDSSLKLLDFDRLDVLDIRTVDAAAIDRANREYDYVFLRGSNYIHQEMDWENAASVLSRLKIPVLAFGVGAQAPAKGKLELPESGRRIWQLISERSTTLGVRGAYTAEVLWSMGIKNTRIVGCPTAFRNNDPELRIDLPALEKVRRVGFTVRREVSKAYSPDVRLYLTRHRDIIKQMASRFDIALMMQGEVEEKMILWGTEEQKEEAWRVLTGEAWWRDWFFDAEIEALWRTRLFYSDVVADYENLVREKDLVLGYRLHGNLMALANGVPSIYFTYDSRTVEFAETFGIPCYDVYSEKEFRLEDYWQQELFEKFNRCYYQRYQDMRDLLDENGVPHKMKPRAKFRKAA